MTADSPRPAVRNLHLNSILFSRGNYNPKTSAQFKYTWITHGEVSSGPLANSTRPLPSRMERLINIPQTLWKVERGSHHWPPGRGPEHMGTFHKTDLPLASNSQGKSMPPHPPKTNQFKSHVVGSVTLCLRVAALKTAQKRVEWAARGSPSLLLVQDYLKDFQQ